MSLNKKNISEVIIDLTDDLPPSPRCPGNSMPQAINTSEPSRLQRTTEPPMATLEMKPWRPQLQLQLRPHPSVDLDDNSTPNSTPSRSWQDRPSAFLYDSVKYNKPTEPNQAIHRSSPHHLTPFANDVISAVGQHPTEQALDAHLAGLKILLPGVTDYSDLLKLGLNPEDLDLFSPPRSPRAANMTTVNRSTYGLSNGSPLHSTFKPAQVEISSNPCRISQQSAIVPPQPNAFHNIGAQARNFSVVISSPPKSSVAKALVFEVPESDEESTPKTLRKPTPRNEPLQRTPASAVPGVPRSRPKRNVLAIERLDSVSATESVQKRRGRPPKPSETPTTGNEPKKRRRKPRLPGPEIKNQIRRPTYHKFICEWKDCQAELHNLETLRHHVFHVHNRKPPLRIWQCLWGKCNPAHHAHPKEEQLPEVLEMTTLKFETKAEWQDHINSAHIIPVAWSMGDGPKVSPLGMIDHTEPKAVPPWLCDENGNQVTPSVEGQPVEEGDPEEENSKRFAKTRHGLHLMYEPVMDPKLYWKMPNEQSYFGLDRNNRSKKG